MALKVRLIPSVKRRMSTNGPKFAKVVRLVQRIPSAFFLWLRQRRCPHVFLLNDLEKTGVPDLETPKNNDYFEWQAYHSQLYKHESVTCRVKWPCCLCGKVFYAHCGLDIAPKYGPMVQNY